MADTVEPRGLAAAILGVTIGFTILTLIIVGLRVWVRITSRCFGADDWLMCTGTIINMVHNGIVIWSCYVGVGTPDSRLTPAISMEGYKSVALWQIFYVTGSVFIKASICTQLARIAIKRLHKMILWGLIGISVVTTLIAVLSVLVRCKPVAATWDPSLGTCINQDIIIVLTYVVSGTNIATDWATAIVPLFILWDIQMRTSLKRMVSFVLGLGVLASVATIIRMPYSSAYSRSSNVLYGVGDIILWTVVECDLGAIAGSMPMLRKLVGRFTKDYSSHPNGSAELNLATLGNIKGRHHPIHDGAVAVTIVAGDDRDSGRDDESTKQMIRVTKTVDQTSMQLGYKDAQRRDD